MASNAKAKLTTEAKFRIAFTLMVVLYPIFNRYRAPVPFLTISEMALVLFFVAAAVRFKVTTFPVIWPAVVLCFYLILDICINSIELSNEAFLAGAGTALRVVCIYFLYAFLARRFMDKDFGMKALMAVSVFVSIYGILQMAASVVGITLTTYIPGLTIMGEDSLDVEVAKKMSYGLQFRCQSLLNEPAALCCYLILPITMLLFGRGEVKHGYPLAIFFSLTCVASLSSTGIIVVALLWAVKFFQTLSKSSIDFRKLFLAFFAAAVLVLFLVFGTNVFQYFINRTFGGAGLSGLMNGTRFYAMDVVLSQSDSLGHVLFGILSSQTVDYLPGYARAYYLYGLIGLALFVFVMGSAAYKGTSDSKWVVLVFAVLNVGTEIMLGNFAIYYLSFAAKTAESKTETIKKKRGCELVSEAS